MLIYSSVNHQSYAERNWTACKNTIIFSNYQIILNIFNKWIYLFHNFCNCSACIIYCLWIIKGLEREWQLLLTYLFHGVCHSRTRGLVRLWQQLLLIYKELAYWVIIIGWLHLWVIHISGWLIITLIIIHVDYYCCFCLEMQKNSVISKVKQAMLVRCLPVF